MPRTRIPTRIALAVAAAAAALAVVLVVGERTRPDGEGSSARTDPIAATAALSPGIVLFGDTLTATVDVVLDRSVLDADTVEVSWAHGPWKAVEPPDEARRDSDQTTHLRKTFVLRCLTALCVPARDTEQVEFEPAEVTYRAEVGEGTRDLSLDVAWPALVVHPRVGDAVGPVQRDALSAPWRADMISLPAVSYRAPPTLVLIVLIAVGVIFLAAAAAIAYRALPEREPPPEPEPEPEPVASPLEQALALLESPATNGAHARRRALELVAEEVERRGENDLAQRARTLAWSQDTPEGDETRALAARLRTMLGRANGVPA